MKNDRENPRVPEVEVNAIFTDRWSPRSFTGDSIPEHQLLSLFEAARWAPSCFNEQPWLFFCATNEKEKEQYLSVLAEKNRAWASKAPVLIFLASRKSFSQNGDLNEWSEFDAGAAWMSLALQARYLGLYAHAMAGFDRDKAHDVLKAPQEDYKIMAAIAVGRKGDPDDLPEEIRKMEKPNTRKPLSEMLNSGSFTKIARQKTV